MYKEMDNKNVYNVLQKLVADTPEARYFEGNNVAYVQYERKVNGIYLITCTLAKEGGCAHDEIAIIIRPDKPVRCLGWHFQDYSRHRVWIDDSGVIHEKIGQGFASWKHNTYDTEMNLISVNE